MVLQTGCSRPEAQNSKKPYAFSYLTQALVQPVYKGDAKLRADPASYQGIYLTGMATKLLKASSMKIKRLLQ